ncbi:peptidase S41 [Tamlana sp. 62-3]|uniref:Peptidase S41 n=1 Tax=Neotamlana sargassicola TaxID=2883125 RepID=A0A9X1I7C3_9FLAO|nr:S41 family peptidase [Tamlana sargassicola]MCB4808778.1 peptidase S41 [Tamlana sargassicola]
MKHLKSTLLLLAILVLATSCFEDGDDVTNPDSVSLEVKDFVWSGMNIFYLYKENIPNLADDRFSSNTEYSEYLNSYTSPEALFESLIYDSENTDRFSWITDDYIALEAQFSGVYTTNGVEFSLYLAPNSTTNLVGVVRLILPNTDASTNGVKRGDIFYAIDDVTLNVDNYTQLLSQSTYTLSFADYNDNGTTDTTDDTIVANGTTASLTKSTYTENPVHTTNILTVGGQNVGYILYNSFTSGSEDELNNIFANFKSNNVAHLVLDLRYNPGGSVATETYLASMITGQHTGEIFTKLVRNDNFDESNYLFTNQIEEGGSINSLNLEKVYVLATDKSASASEGLINGLRPYINVIHIGENTVGKTQASVTLYDSPNFGRTGANQNHTYAMQPLIANGVNKNNEQVPSTGLTPTVGFEYTESPTNLGVLGDENEPMLALALEDIENSTGKSSATKLEINNTSLIFIKDSNDFNPLDGGMRID